jgi:hypothetical protein
VLRVLNILPLVSLILCAGTHARCSTPLTIAVISLPIARINT